AVRLRDTKTGTLKQTVRVPAPGNVEVTGAAFAPAGRLLAVRDQVGSVSVWEPYTGRRRWSADPPTIDTLSGGAGDLAFSSDSQLLAVGLSPTPAERRGGEVRVYDARTGKPLWREID